MKYMNEIKNISRRLARKIVIFFVFIGAFAIGVSYAEADFFDDLEDFFDPSERLERLFDGDGPINLPLPIVIGTSPAIPDADELFGAPLKPVAETRRAEDIYQNSATLRGYVNPRGSLSTKAYFQFGISRRVGNRTKKIQVNLPSDIELELTRLRPNTTYYYRIVAENNIFTERGEIKSFTTGETNEPPPTPTPTPPLPCIERLDFEEVKENLSKGKIHLTRPNIKTGSGLVRNDTDCPLPISLAVFTFDDLNDIELPKGSAPKVNDFTFQTLFDGTKNVVVQPHSSRTLSVRLPSCNFQIDYFYNDQYPTKLERGQTPFFLDPAGGPGGDR